MSKPRSEELKQLYPFLEQKIRAILKEVRGSSSEIGGAEVERLLSRLENPDDPLHFLVGSDSEDQLASWSVSVLEAKKKNRTLLNHLVKPRIDYNYGVLAGTQYCGEQSNTPPGGQEAADSYLKIVNEKGYDTFLDDLYKELSAQVNDAPCTDYEWLMTVKEKMGNFAYQTMVNERLQALALGLTTIVMFRVDQYIKCTSGLLSDVLFKLILNYGFSSSDLIKKLTTIIKEEIRLKDRMSSAAKEQMRSTPYQKLDNPIGQLHASAASQALSCYLTKKSVLEEIETIDYCFEQEIRDNRSEFSRTPIFTHKIISDYQSDAEFLYELTGKTKVGSDDYRRYNTTVELIRAYNNLYDDLPSFDASISY